MRMRWNELADQTCSVARTVSVIGDRWTLLVLRDCFLRIRRFEQFQEKLGITRPVLAAATEMVMPTTRAAPPSTPRPNAWRSRSTESAAVPA
jgi:hypothetical protein